MKTAQPRSSKFLFLKTFLTKPLSIGSVTPSSRFLAKKMIASLNLQNDEIVVELGPGTGIFTNELLRQGTKPENIILIEFNPDFVSYLRKQFPAVKVIEGDASQLPELLSAMGIKKIRRIISGIPMRSLPPSLRIGITAAIADSLEVGGIAVQFTYGLACPLPRITLQIGGLIGKRVGTIYRNIPPAFVWQYVKT